MIHYWMSFVDLARKPGEQLLGVVIVEAENTALAMTSGMGVVGNPNASLSGIVPLTRCPPERFVGRVLGHLEAVEAAAFARH